MNQDLVSEIIPDENTNPNIKSKSSLSIASSENSRHSRNSPNTLKSSNLSKHITSTSTPEIVTEETAYPETAEPSKPGILPIPNVYLETTTAAAANVFTTPFKKPSVKSRLPTYTSDDEHSTDGAASVSSSQVSSNYAYSRETCLNLALTGEKLCMQNECIEGIKYFKRAVAVGSDDLTILSAIYSQMGNAYYYLQDYKHALEYHRHDLNLAKKMNDRQSQAKAYGNLANVLKCMATFEEAMICSEKQLEIARFLKNLVIESRALYNLGNIQHSKGKQIMSDRAGVSCLLSSSYYQVDNFSFIDDLTNCFDSAVKYYEENLVLTRRLGDLSGEGRALGQLGNVHYRLGHWEKAVQYHEKRLHVAQRLKDISGERRALANLANAHAGAGRLLKAIEYYMLALKLARKTKEPEAEAQACWSLAAAHSLLDNVELAINYQRRHLSIAQKLKDRVGEAKACAQLAPLHERLGEFDQAKIAARKAKEIAWETGDEQTFAQAREAFNRIVGNTMCDISDLGGGDGDCDVDNLAETLAESIHIKNPDHHSTGIFDHLDTEEFGSQNLGDFGNKMDTSTPINSQYELKKAPIVPKSNSNPISNFITTMKRTISSNLQEDKSEKADVLPSGTGIGSNHSGSASSSNTSLTTAKGQHPNIIAKAQHHNNVKIKIKSSGLFKKKNKNNSNGGFKSRENEDLLDLLETIQGSGRRLEDQRKDLTQFNPKARRSRLILDEDIPIFTSKQSSNTPDDLDFLLNSLAPSASRRLDQQRTSTEHLVPGQLIDEFIPLPNTSLTIPENNETSEMQTGNSQINNVTASLSSRNNNSNDNQITQHRENVQNQETTPMSDSNQNNGNTNDDPQNDHRTQRNSTQHTNIQTNSTVQSQFSRNNTLNSQSSINFDQQSSSSRTSSTFKKNADDAFLDKIMDAQAKRIDNQRVNLKNYKTDTDLMNRASGFHFGSAGNITSSHSTSRPKDSNLVSSTVPDEDLFDILARVQGTRLNDQRTSVAKPETSSGSTPKYVSDELPKFTSK